jgi:diacylglycerol O-acyltransferase / wax synthase
MRQLTTLDAQFLAVESAQTYGHVGSLAIYDPSTAPGGELGIEDLCRLVAQRMHLLPPLHWRLAEVPLGVDLPYWVEDPDFDLDFHIRESAVPPPGDDRRLAETVSRIFARPLDRGRPLWEIYLIHGLPDGNVALLTKIHHAVVDGVSGNEVLTVLLDPSPEGRELPRKREQRPDTVPSELSMAGRDPRVLEATTQRPPRTPFNAPSRAIGALPSAS